MAVWTCIFPHSPQLLWQIQQLAALCARTSAADALQPSADDPSERHVTRSDTQPRQKRYCAAKVHIKNRLVTL